MIKIDQYRVFDYNNPPEWLDSDWWKDTDNCNHLDNRVHQARLHGAAAMAILAAKNVGDDEGDHYITDLGAGDGGLLSVLKGSVPDVSYKRWGYEVISDSVRYAKEIRMVDVREANVLTHYNRINLAPTIVATEMLEHLEKPYEFVGRVFNDPRVTNFIASSPHSETRDYHEWNHAWVWDREGYRDMFEASGWKIVRHVDVEWSQVIWATK